MGVDMVDVARLDARLRHRVGHRAGQVGTVTEQVGHVDGVTAQRKARDLTVDGGTTGTGVFQLLQHEHGAPFGEHKPVPARVEGPRRSLGPVVEAGGQAVDDFESSRGDGGDGRLARAGER
jgi:hypothetical protein